MANDGILRPFDRSSADEVLGWVADSDESHNWASLPHRPDNSSIFVRWHSDPDIHPFVLWQDGAAIGYGEIWTDAGEVELARILVKPACRGSGIGRRLVGLLLAEAARSGLANAFVRVYPGNAAAIACYQHAGFRRVDPEIEASWNRSQPAAYVWLEFRL
jgi:ribosomal protein S18 acetylase RimI-like enzyme